MSGREMKDVVSLVEGYVGRNNGRARSALCAGTRLAHGRRFGGPRVHVTTHIVARVNG